MCEGAKNKEVKEPSQVLCPYLSEEAMELLTIKIADRVVTHMNARILPEIQKQTAQQVKKEFKSELMEELGEETLEVGKKFFVKFIYAVGFAVIFVSALLAAKGGGS